MYMLGGYYICCGGNIPGFIPGIWNGLAIGICYCICFFILGLPFESLESFLFMWEGSWALNLLVFFIYNYMINSALA